MSYNYIKNHIINKYSDSTNKSLFFTYTDLHPDFIQDNLPKSCTKIEQFKKIVENIFISNDILEKYITLYSKINKTYYSFCKLVMLWRLKRGRIHNNENLYMNPISIHDSNVLPIYQNGQIYLFTIRELLNGLNCALSNTTELFTHTLMYKNPYNNMIFNKSTLYNIYFAIRSSNFIIPETIQAFFLSDFDIVEYSKNNEYIIRETYIKRYVFQSSHTTLLPNIFIMLENYSDHDIQQIHKDFPITALVDSMRPFLYMYLQSTSCLDLSKQKYCRCKLIRELKLFFDNNPNFGRKIVSVKSTRVLTKLNTKNKFAIKRTIVHEFAEINYNYKKLDLDKFMNNHKYNNMQDFNDGNDERIIHHSDNDDDSYISESLSSQTMYFSAIHSFIDTNRPYVSITIDESTTYNDENDINNSNRINTGENENNTNSVNIENGIGIGNIYTNNDSDSDNDENSNYNSSSDDDEYDDY